MGYRGIRTGSASNPFGQEIDAPEIAKMAGGSIIVGTGISTDPVVRILVSQAQAEAGTETVVRGWTAERVAQAIAALAAGGALNDNFAYVFDTTTQAVAVANTFQDLTFNTNDELDGWTHAAGTNVFGCTKTAKYKVTVDVNIEKTGGAAQAGAIRALFNSVEVPASYRPIDITSSNVSMPMGRTFFVDATTGQDLEIELVGTETTVQVAPGPNPGTPTINPSANITIERIT